jgi:hypothetical protein
MRSSKLFFVLVTLGIAGCRSSTAPARAEPDAGINKDGGIGMLGGGGRSDTDTTGTRSAGADTVVVADSAGGY